MKRLYLAAVAGLCAVVPVGAQERALAPTAPVVPPPSLHNGSLVAPAGAWGGGGGGLLSRNNWSPVRSPAGANDLTYSGAVAGVPCGPTGCDTGGSRRSCLERIKSWLCFQYSPTELPKMRPAPYVTPIQGLLGCSSGSGCASCGTTGGYPSGQPVPQPTPLPVPMKPPAGAGAVLMPSRGTQGMTGPTEFGTVKPTANHNGSGSVVNTGYRAPQR